MAGFNHIKRCLELADRDIAFAMEDRLVAKALLDRLAAVSRPGEGGPKLLLVFARMASQACDWIDGDLRIEILGDAETSVLEVLTDLGAGMRERVFPSITVRIPLEEFTRAVERVPHMIEPLTIAAKSPRRMVLSATEEVRKSSLPPAMVEIDSESLYERADLSSAKVPVIQPPPTSNRQLPVSKSTPRMEAVVAPRPKGPAVVKKRSSRPPPRASEPKVEKHEAQKLEAPPLDAPKRPQIAPFAKFVPPAKAAPAKAKSVPPPKAAAPAKAKSIPPAKGKSIPPKGKSLAPKGKSLSPKRMLSEPPDEEQIDTGWDDEG